MSEQSSAELSLLVSRERAENAFANALRLFVGKGRRYSYTQLAKAVGMVRAGEAHTKPLYDFLSYPAGHPDHRPLHMGLQFSIMRFLGAEFTNEWAAITGQGAFDLPEDEPAPGDLAADNADDCAVVTRAALDGNFSDNKADLKVVGTRMATRAQHLLRAAA